jgi:hypothetical protein
MFTSQAHWFSDASVSSVSRAPVGTSAARFASIMTSFVAVKIFNSRVSTFGRDSEATGVIRQLIESEMIVAETMNGARFPVPRQNGDGL